VVCATGPLTNLARLLDSPGDDLSSRNGHDLVARKVKLLVVMGGKYPAGKEWNFDQDRPAAAKVLAEWPTPILCSGFEIGERVFTGNRLHKETPASDPVRAAFALFPGVGKDRESWDETATLAAVRGPETRWTVSERGTITLDLATGADHFIPSRGGRHTFLIERDSPAEVKNAIEDLMVQPPRSP